MNKLVQFVKESWHEVTKEVHSPKMRELQSSATLLLIASIIFALVVGWFLPSLGGSRINIYLFEAE